MIKKLINFMRGGHHSHQNTKPYRNENGFEQFVEDYVRFNDIYPINIE